MKAQDTVVPQTGLDALAPAVSAATASAATAALLPWQVLGAAVRGVSHERLDMPCQDALAFQVLPGEVLTVALSDGAGSAPFSDSGAQAAVAAALDAMPDAFQRGLPEDADGWQPVMREVSAKARQAVLDLAESSDEPVRSYACTLTCVVAVPGSPSDRLVVAQIGDGAVVAMDADEQLYTVTRLQRGEYANETHFLVQEDALDQLVIDVVDRSVQALAVMSDGLIRLALKMPSQEPHTPFFTPLFRFAASVEEDDAKRDAAGEQLAAFLSSERVNARTDDDKSLVLAVRGAALKAAQANAAGEQGSA